MWIVTMPKSARTPTMTSQAQDDAFIAGAGKFKLPAVMKRREQKGLLST